MGTTYYCTSSQWKTFPRQEGTWQTCHVKWEGRFCDICHPREHIFRNQFWDKPKKRRKRRTKRRNKQAKTEDPPMDPSEDWDWDLCEGIQSLTLKEDPAESSQKEDPSRPITPPGMKVRLNTKKGTKIADVNLVSSLPAGSTLSRYLCRCASQDRKGIAVRCLSTRLPYHCISSRWDSDLSRCLHQSRSHTALRKRSPCTCNRKCVPHHSL